MQHTTGADALTSFRHQPALDGVRGLAVIAVLGFHLGLGGMSGGYLGVSVFFTLSGYLITSLLLTEHTRTGVVDLPAFYQRRARRLVPAGLLVLGLVVVLALSGVVQPRSTFRVDLLASMFQVLNWVRLFGEQRYADLFVAPSPVDHYWSLGIEEQFYVLWPLAVVLLLRLVQRRAARHLLVRYVVAIWLVLSVSAPLTAQWWSGDAAYFATWARAAEVLAGAVLATWLHDRRRPLVSPWVGRLAPLTVGVVVLLVVVTPAGHGWAYAGGLPLFAVVSAALVLGLQVPSATRTALSTPLLVWVGRISYGLYLFHWPVYVVLDAERTGLSSWSLDAVRVVVTVLLSAVSHRLLERPVRDRRLLPSAVRLTVALGTAVVVVGATVFAVGLPGSDAPSTGPSVVSVPTTVAPGSTRPGETTTTAPPARVVAIFGDSVPAWLLRDGAAAFSRTDVVLVNGAIEACDGMVGMPPQRDRRGDVLPVGEACEEWNTWYPEVLGSSGRVDAALVMVGISGALDTRVDDAWRGPCDGLDWYVDDLAARVDFLRSRGLDVVFALPSALGRYSTFMMPDDHPARMACVRAALASMLTLREVPVVDLEPRFCPDGDCDAIRPTDGVHVAPEFAGDTLDWLMGEVVDVLTRQSTEPG